MDLKCNMKENKGLWVVGGAVAVLTSAWAIRVLLKNRDVRRKLGFEKNSAMVDETSDESFPASDAPSWTPTTSIGANRG